MEFSCKENHQYSTLLWVLKWSHLQRINVTHIFLCNTYTTKKLFWFNQFYLTCLSLQEHLHNAHWCLACAWLKHTSNESRLHLILLWLYYKGWLIIYLHTDILYQQMAQINMSDLFFMIIPVNQIQSTVSSDLWEYQGNYYSIFLKLLHRARISFYCLNLVFYSEC